MKPKTGLMPNTNAFGFRVAMLLAFLLTAVNVTLGDGPMFLGAQYGTGATPLSAAIGDLNDD